MVGVGKNFACPFTSPGVNEIKIPGFVTASMVDLVKHIGKAIGLPLTNATEAVPIEAVPIETVPIEAMPIEAVPKNKTFIGLSLKLPHALIELLATQFTPKLMDLIVKRTLHVTMFFFGIPGSVMRLKDDFWEKLALWKNLVMAGSNTVNVTGFVTLTYKKSNLITLTANVVGFDENYHITLVSQHPFKPFDAKAAVDAVSKDGNFTNIRGIVCGFTKDVFTKPFHLSAEGVCE